MNYIIEQHFEVYISENETLLIIVYDLPVNLAIKFVSQKFPGTFFSFTGSTKPKSNTKENQTIG
jgi:hypothetical protein